MVSKSLFLFFFVLAVLSFGCTVGTSKNALKDSVVSSEQISFADYKNGLAAEKFAVTGKPENPPDYILVPESSQFPSDESYPSLDVSASYDVLEPGSATQEQLIEIFRNEDRVRNGVVPSGDEISNPDTVGDTAGSSDESPSPSDVAVILPSEADYYLAGEFPGESVGQDSAPGAEVNASFVSKLEQLGQILSDMRSIDSAIPKKIQIAEKDNSVTEITGGQSAPVVPLAFFALEDTLSPVEMYAAVKTGCSGVHVVDETFFSEPNRINVYSFYPEENAAIVFGLLVDPASDQPLLPRETPFENPQINLYSDAATISGIFESQNPIEKFVEAQQNGLVFLEGLDIPTSLKLMLAENALKVNGEGFGLVEETDCKEIQAEWNRLRVEREKLDCDEIQKLLDAAKNRKSNLEQSLGTAQKSLDAADKEVQKWKEHLQKFLKDSGLENDDVSLDPPQGADAWSYANFNRHGIQMWIKGDAGAERVIGHFAKWKKEIDAYRAEVEKAQRKKDSGQAVVDGLKKDLDAADAEISSLEASLSDCLNRKADLERQMQNLESLYKNCLEKLTTQADLSKKSKETGSADSWVQLDNIYTGEKISHFSELDRQIADLEKAIGETDPECSEILPLQEAAFAALEQAKSKREEAVAKFREANGLYSSGNLSESQAALNEANDLYGQAKAIATDAQKKAQNAINAKVNCRMNLEAKKNGKAAELAEWNDWIKLLRERSLVKGEPFEMDKTDATVRLDIELRELVPEAALETDCDCPFKLLSAAKHATGQVYAGAIKDIGIGVMKAPIDALSPEGLLGKAAQKIASWTLSYLGADSFGDFAKDAIIDELVGAVLPETDIPLIDKPVSGGTSSAVSASVDDWLAGSGIQIWTFESDQSAFHSALCGDFDCANLKLVIVYNPNTRHMLTLIKGDCCPGLLMISTTFDEEGVSIDSQAKYFP